MTPAAAVTRLRERMKLLTLAVGLAVLGVIYARIDFPRFLATLGRLDPLWLTLAFACFAPQILVAAVRWRMLLRDLVRLPLGDALRQVLAGSILNLVLPSKMGDVAKGWFLAQAMAVPLSRGLVVALAEKILDLGGLCAILLAATALRGRPADPLALAAVAGSAAVVAGVGIAVALPVPEAVTRPLPGRLRRLVADWSDVRALWLASPARFAAALALTLGLWILHVGQVALFFRAAGSAAPPLAVYALVPVAILVGLLPLSLAGLGTRDAALIHLFAAWDDPAVLASVGLLTATRYLVPALAGLPFLSLVLRARAALVPERPPRVG
jgi:uncharacterized membrane protein YbhN (UPF0104 family)